MSDEAKDWLGTWCVQIVVMKLEVDYGRGGGPEGLSLVLGALVCRVVKGYTGCKFDSMANKCLDNDLYGTRVPGGSC